MKEDYLTAGKLKIRKIRNKFDLRSVVISAKMEIAELIEPWNKLKTTPRCITVLLTVVIIVPLDSLHLKYTNG